MDELNRRLRDREKAAAKRARRLEAMTPEEREAHEVWQKTHRPGDPKKRAADRRCRQQDIEARETFARVAEPRPVSDEVKTLERRADELRRELATLRSGAIDLGIFE